MAFETIIEHFLTIFFGSTTLVQWFKIHKLNEKNQLMKEKLSVAKVTGYLKRISSVEFAARTGTFRYKTLIRDNILTGVIVDEIYAGCVASEVSGAELDKFLELANKALANQHWENLDAKELTEAAKALIKKISK